MKKKGGRFQDIVKKGVLQDKREKMEVLEVQIDNLIKDISYAIFMDDGVESIDMKTAKVQIDDLEKKVAEYLKLKEEVEELS